MKILAIDTSSNICSTALLEDNNLIDENNLDNGRTHSENLMPLVKELLERNKRGCLLKYGVDNASKLAEVKEKRVKTMIEKYGVTNSYLIPEIYEKARLDVSVIKRVNNCKNTLMEKYGVNCSFNLPWVKCNKNTPEAKIKEYNTKLKNKSFKGKTSNEENAVFIILSNKFGENDIVRPYIDERYKIQKQIDFMNAIFILNQKIYL